MSRQEVCRDKQYVVTSSVSRPMSRQAVCRNQCRDKQALSRQESFVATRMLQKPKKKLKFDILTKFQAHFTLGPYIYSFFR